MNRKQALLGAGTLLIAACSGNAGTTVPSLIGRGSTGNGSSRRPFSTTVSNNVVKTTQNGMTLTTDLNNGTMTLSGYGQSQTINIPAAGSLQAGATYSMPGATYTVVDSTHASFTGAYQWSTGSLSMSTDSTQSYYAASRHVIMTDSADAIGFPENDAPQYTSGGATGGKPTPVPLAGVNPGGGKGNRHNNITGTTVSPDLSWSCGWAIFELALAATGLGLSVGALIGATGGIGAAAVVGLVAAHLGALASLVDTAMNCGL